MATSRVVPPTFSAPMISGGNRACSSRTWFSSLMFHSGFMPATLALLRIFSSFCQPLRYWLPPSVSQSAAGQHGGAGENRHDEVALSHSH